MHRLRYHDLSRSHGQPAQHPRQSTSEILVSRYQAHIWIQIHDYTEDIASRFRRVLRDLEARPVFVIVVDISGIQPIVPPDCSRLLRDASGRLHRNGARLFLVSRGDVFTPGDR